MNIMTILLLTFLTLPTFSQSGELKTRVLVLDQRRSVNYEIQWHEVLQLKPKMKCKAAEGFYLSTFIVGLEAGLDGKVSYAYNVEGTNRSDKVERHLGGLISGSDQIRSDEVVSFNMQEMFLEQDIGIWDFKSPSRIA
jgi:hypothetical protein